MPFSPILASAILSSLGFTASLFFIPVVRQWCANASIGGIDLNKPKSRVQKIIPEGLGIVPGVIYLIILIFLQLFHTDSPARLIEFNASLASICFILLLGFGDDVLNLRWRYKLVFPFVATLPLLVAYSGSTTVLIPKFLFPLFNRTDLNLGIFYYIYMCLLAVFCSNSINIYAGINGLEVGQAIIIGFSVVVHNLICIMDGKLEISLNETGVFDHLLEFVLQNRFSVMIMIPFIAVNLPLFYYNKYPASVFVGDTLTYFAGFTIAVTGILGHFSKSLLLFFIPQIINFLISFPQLIRLIPCPRHRLPHLDPETGKLVCVRNHWTLINLVLSIKGPMHEAVLCNVLLGFQVLCCFVGLVFRHVVAQHLFKLK